MRLFNFSDFTYIFQNLIIHLFANVSFLAELNGIDFAFIEFSASMDLISFFFFFFYKSFLFTFKLHKIVSFVWVTAW